MGFISSFLSLLDTALDATNALVTVAENYENEKVQETQKVQEVQEEYQKSVFLWYFSKKPSKILKKTEYPHFFSYECAIENVSTFHQKMVDEEYFYASTDEEKLSMLTIPELKEILKNFELSTKGKKIILIQRILENISSQNLTKYLPEKMYSLSPKGIEYIKEHEDCIKLHQHRNLDISWSEYISAKEEGFNFYDVVWKILNQRIIEDRFNFGRHEYLQMYQLLDEESKHKEALEMLLRILYIDLHGGKDDFIFFAPGIINAIAEHKAVFTEEMIDKLYQWKIPKRCNKKLFTKIIHDIMNNNFDETQAMNELQKL